MTNRLLAILIATAVIAAPRAHTAGRAPDWRARITAIRASFAGDLAVYAKHLGTGETFALDADAVYETFSVIKVPIMAEVLRQVQEGRFSLSDRITYKAEDARLPSGVLFLADAGL